MTTLLLEDVVRPAKVFGPADPTPRPTLTLEALVTRAWTELDLRGRTACPACGGRMETGLAPAGDRVGGRCADCGSELH
jgi:tRNA(Ile2) C34 agmatinyltransferase TiaS